MTKKKKKKKKKTVQRVSYEGKTISVYYPVQIRLGVCKGCKRTKKDGEIKRTGRHHFKYAYELKTVRANPVLALDNSEELCWRCHRIADGLRMLLLANPRGALRPIKHIVQVAVLLPEDQRKHFTKLCKEWLRK